MINAGWTAAYKGVKLCKSSVMVDKGDWLALMKKEVPTSTYTDLTNNSYQWSIRDSTNCFPTDGGADEHSCCARSIYTIQTFESCQQLCIDTVGCDGITISNGKNRRCYLRHNLVLDNCVSSSGWTSAKITELETEFFTVSGDCDIAGDCVSSKNYPSSHGHDESCAVTMKKSASVSMSLDFELETCCDHLRIRGKDVESVTEIPSSLNAGERFTWSTDESIARKGWRICFSDPSAGRRRLIVRETSQ